MKLSCITCIIVLCAYNVLSLYLWDNIYECTENNDRENKVDKSIAKAMTWIRFA